MNNDVCDIVITKPGNGEFYSWYRDLLGKTFKVKSVSRSEFMVVTGAEFTTVCNLQLIRKSDCEIVNRS